MSRALRCRWQCRIETRCWLRHTRDESRIGVETPELRGELGETWKDMSRLVDDSWARAEVDPGRRVEDSSTHARVMGQEGREGGVTYSYSGC